MEALPDPTSENFQQGRNWFRSNIPGKLKLKDISLQFHENSQITWTVTYIEKEQQFSLTTFRKYLSSVLGKHCVVKHVVINFDGIKKLVATIIPRRRKANTLWNFIVPCLNFTNSKVQLPDIQLGKTPPKAKTSQKFNPLKVTPAQCIILGSDMNRYSISEIGDVPPRKLFYGDSDVTRKVFGKSRLCNHFVRIMSEGLNKPLIWSKNKMNYKTFVKENDADHNISEKPIVRPALKQTPVQKVEIPFDYSNLERKYMLSKLRDRTVFRAALDWVAIKHYQQKYSQYPSSKQLKMDPEVVNNLASGGLPADESLLEIFHTHCKLVGIDRNDLENELGRVGSQYYRKQYPC